MVIEMGWGGCFIKVACAGALTCETVCPAVFATQFMRFVSLSLSLSLSLFLSLSLSLSCTRLLGGLGRHYQFWGLRRAILGCPISGPLTGLNRCSLFCSNFGLSACNLGVPYVYNAILCLLALVVGMPSILWLQNVKS